MSEELFDLFDDETTDSEVEDIDEEVDIPDDVEDLLTEAAEQEEAEMNEKQGKVAEKPKLKEEKPKITKQSSFDDLFDDTPKKKDKFEETIDEPEEVTKKPVVTKKQEPQFIEDELKELSDMGFEFVEAQDSNKSVLMFYGRKGEGKTFQTFKLPGKLHCLSFDGKSVKIKKLMKEDERIHVYDAMKYYAAYPEQEQLRTGKKTFLYVEYILDQLEKLKDKDRPDWIIIDGLERLHRISEMVMRYDNNIMPYEGFKNLNLWKVRRDCLAKIHARAIRIANKGVAYTTYLDKERVADEVDDSEIADDVPRWIGVIMEHTDVVFKCYKKWLSQELIFRVTIESSKDERFPTGRILNVTNSGIFEQLGIDK